MNTLNATELWQVLTVVLLSNSKSTASAAGGTVPHQICSKPSACAACPYGNILLLQVAYASSKSLLSSHMHVDPVCGKVQGSCEAAPCLASKVLI